MDKNVSPHKIIDDYYIGIPDKYIICDIRKEYGISRLFYIVYILIDRYHTPEYYSWITVGEIFDLCGYKQTVHKPKIFGDIIKVLDFMKSKKMIDFDIDKKEVNYRTGIKVKINLKNFYTNEKFTKITIKQFEKIMSCKNNISKENIILVYLYISSHIFKTENNPEAYYGSIRKIEAEISMAKRTIIDCIDFLISPNNDDEPLLIKRETGSITVCGKRINVPNIYVHNTEMCSQEIEWAMQKLLDLYNVDHFDPPFYKKK